jgi:serine/threonine protein phosphatase 1
MIRMPWFLRKADVAPVPPRHNIPLGERVYAIGDIHGRADLLYQLLDQIAADDKARGAADTTLVFLGDLVDRGPTSSEVVDYAMRLAASDVKCVFLMGNHEELFLLTCAGDQHVGGTFHRAGGRATLLSYGVDATVYDDCDPHEISALADRVVPQAHIDFIEGFRDYWVCGDYCFVHAGIRPDVPLEQQTSADMRWIRNEFLTSPIDHGLMVIHGHTITQAVDEQYNRIGIDTGAYASGKLTAIGLESGERWYLQTGAAA